MTYLTDFEKRQLRELAKRTDSFSEVALYWNPRNAGNDQELIVSYCDSDGRDFYLYPPRDRALEAYKRPLAFAEFAINGKLPVAA